MKILVLTDHFATGGGAGQIARFLTEELAKDNEVRVLTAKAPKDLSHFKFRVFQYELDYPLILRNYFGLYRRKSLKILERHLKDFKPEIVHVHNLHTYWSYASLGLLERHRIKNILTFHDVSSFTPYTKLCNIPYRNENNNYVFDYRFPWYRHAKIAKFSYNPFRNFIIKRYLAKATHKVAVSQALAGALGQNGIKVDKIIHNGISSERNVEPERGHSIFFGGRLSTSKGMIEAVHYLAVLKSKYDLAPTLLIAGEKGIASQKLMREAERLGVADQVKLLGWLENDAYENELSKCGVVIVPSICFDSLPTVILEAMKFSKPVVATIFGGGRELVVDGKTGYICDPFDSEQNAAKIKELLGSQDKAREMGEQGNQLLRSSFSHELMVKNYLELYKA